MSTTYFAWTFPAQDIGSVSPQSPDSVLALMSFPVAVGRTLMSASRNGWLAYTLKRVASDLNIEALGFVNSASSPVQCDSSGSRWVICILDGVDIQKASVGIERLLKCAADDPADFERRLGSGHEAEEISEALASSSESYDPIRGPDGEDEGDGPVYLFAYLKCLLSLLRYAHEHSLCIVHARHEH